MFRYNLLERHMPHAHYYVVLHQNEWRISFNDTYYGPYRTQAEAIAVAVNTAHEAGKKGHDSQVLVQGTDHKWRTEWTYGNDPYPPPG